MSGVGSGEIDDRLHYVLARGSIRRSPAEIAASRVENPLLDSPAEPSCVLRPADADELLQLMRLANDLRLNLTVASSTGRHCKGGFAAVKQNMRVDLSHWRGIPWINRRNRVCMIEPGVTYGELLEALEPHWKNKYDRPVLYHHTHLLCKCQTAPGSRLHNDYRRCRHTFS